MRPGRLVLSLVAVALLAEVALRLDRFGVGRAALGEWVEAPPWALLRTIDADGDPVPVPHADVAWALAPGQPVVRYRLNGDGLRATGEPGPPAPDVCRVLALGDAYTFGYGVAEDAAYPAELARLLAPEIRVEVLNAGFPNVDVEQARRRLATLLPRLRPDVVLVSFDWWNVPLSAEPAPHPPRWSTAWVIANLEEKAERVAQRVGFVHVALDAGRRALAPRVFPASGLARELEALAHPPEQLGERWTRTEAAVRGMAADARAAGARPALVVAPLDLEVDESRVALYRDGRLPYPAHGFVAPDRAATPARAAALRGLAAGADLPLVDVTAAFRAHARERPFLDGDYHASAAGYRLLAREVAAWFLRARPCAPAR